MLLRRRRLGRKSKPNLQKKIVRHVVKNSNMLNGNIRHVASTCRIRHVALTCVAGVDGALQRTVSVA